MNKKHTLEQLKELKVYDITSCHETELNQAVQQQPDAHTLGGLMTEAEAIYRIHLRTNLYLRLAELRTMRCQSRSIAAMSVTYPKNSFYS